MKRLLRTAAIVVAALLIGIQAVPYGRNHVNPPVRREPAWDSPETRALAVRACFDCHSNQAVWPWYSTIAPFSWLIQRDVEEGRRELNFSEWDRLQEEASESARTVRKGTMPPWYYQWARLSASEREALIGGLAATFGEKADDKSEGRPGRRRENRR